MLRKFINEMEEMGYQVDERNMEHGSTITIINKKDNFTYMSVQLDVRQLTEITYNHILNEVVSYFENNER